MLEILHCKNRTQIKSLIFSVEHNQNNRQQRKKKLSGILFGTKLVTFYFNIWNVLLLFWLFIILILEEMVRLEAAPLFIFICNYMYQYFSFLFRSTEVNKNFLLMILSATASTKISSYS